MQNVSANVSSLLAQHDFRTEPLSALLPRIEGALASDSTTLPQLFENLFQFAPIGIAVGGSDYRFIKVNRALSESGKRIDARSLREFDERYTAKYAGFRDRTHYYETADVTQSIQNIAIPTILMTASDDPFVSASSYRNTRLSPQVFRHIEESGGHIGYLTDGGRFQLRPWLTDTLEMWLKNFAC